MAEKQGFSAFFGLETLEIDAERKSLIQISKVSQFKRFCIHFCAKKDDFGRFSCGGKGFPLYNKTIRPKKSFQKHHAITAQPIKKPSGTHLAANQS